MARRQPLRFLLDTHVVLWTLRGELSHLRPRTLEAISDTTNDVHVSPASVWELEIKRASGKLAAPLDLLEQVERSYLQPLPVTLAHGVAAGRLPLHHKDPFDRMLVAQAQLEGLTLVTDDAQLTRYDVPILRA